MFIWPHENPCDSASPCELTDFAELLCLRSGSTSITALSRMLGRLEDNDYSRGVDEYSFLDESLQNAMKEAERRASACSSGYPFQIGTCGTSLTLSVTGPQSWLYAYLLLATRLNMKTNRTHGNIDGTLLLERVASDVLSAYFGTRARTLVFGTSTADANFQERINSLCRELGEGSGFKNRNPASPTAKDAKLDVVAWKPFADKRAGKVVVFAQCKTGRNWRHDMAQLQPIAFCNSWMVDPLPVHPLRIFLVAESVPTDYWHSQTAEAGIILDRCRLVDFGTALSAPVLADITAWTLAAAADSKISLPSLAAIR